MNKKEFFKSNLIVTISDFQEMQKNGRISENAYMSLFYGHKADKIAFNGYCFILVDDEYNTIKTIGNYQELSTFLEK